MPKENPAPTPTRNPEQPPKPSPRRRKKKSSLLQFIKNAHIVIGTIIIITLVLELFARLLGSVSLIVTSGLSIVGGAFAAFKDIFKPDPEDEKPKRGDSLVICLKMGLRNILRRIARNATYILVIFVALCVLTSTALAAVHVMGHLTKNLSDYLNNVEEQPVEDDGGTDETPPAPPEPEEPPEEDEPEEPPVEDTPEEPQPPAAVPSQYVALTDLDRHLTISSERSEELYYLGGEYAAPEDADDAKIYTKVSEYVLAQVSQRKEDEFRATDSTDAARALAYSASIKEMEMKDSDDLDIVIKGRKDAYDKAPGAEVAGLIAENYNGYGLAYHSIGGIEDTMEFYWANSIEWLHKKLTFSHSGAEIANILEQIGSRYHDLADHQIFAEKTENRERAGKLSEAYNTLAEYYRQENAEW